MADAPQKIAAAQSNGGTSMEGFLSSGRVGSWQHGRR